jgi:hypothetical protein
MMMGLWHGSVNRTAQAQLCIGEVIGEGRNDNS